MEVHPVSDVETALAIQEDLAGRVIRTDDLPPIDRVTGVDVAYAPDDRWLIAAAVTLDAVTLEPLEQVIVDAEVRFPYVPGLFSFREAPAVIAAVERLAKPAQLVICDGHGIAHPRRFGLACHLGVVLDVPTIGCAKSRLMGTHDDPPSVRGGSSPLMDGGEVIGAALRTQDGIRPVYASIGHRVSLTTACDWILRLSPRFRLPETTRAADHEVREALRQGQGRRDQGRRDSVAGSTG